MHPDEVVVDDDTVRNLLAEQQPHLAKLGLQRLDTWGTDHVIYRIGSELAVRLPKIGWASGQGELEARWLPVLATALHVALPIPVYVGQPAHGFSLPWYVVPWLEGVPPRGDETLLARDLAQFVRELEAIDASGAPLPQPGQRGGPLRLADRATRAAAERLRAHPPADIDALLEIWAAGLSAPVWSGPPRWVHGDLMAGNLLMQAGRLSAVIDWGGLKAGDPAVELMVAWSLFDAATRASFRTALGFVDDAMWLRGRAWAVSAALQALPYYRDSNPDIVARSLRTVQAVLGE